MTGDEGAASPTAGAGAGRVVVRPQRVRWVTAVTATVLVVTFAVIAFLLRGDGTGVYFRLADQVAMMTIGALMAAAVLLFARPRLIAGPDGVVVRNLLGDKSFPWALVEDISFPDGSSFAHLELPEDEYVTIMAIQAADGDRAVVAINAVRELHRTHAPARPIRRNPA